MKKILVLLVDRKKARMFTIKDGIVNDSVDYSNEQVPQKVRHGDNMWDAQNKIFRHIEDHLHRHLKQIALKASAYMKNKNIQFIIIGGHKPLLAKIKKHLPIPLQKMVLGTFVAALNIPISTIARHSMKVVEELEMQKTKAELEKSLAP